MYINQDYANKPTMVNIFNELHERIKIELNKLQPPKSWINKTILEEHNKKNILVWGLGSDQKYKIFGQQKALMKFMKENQSELMLNGHIFLLEKHKQWSSLFHPL